MNRNYAVNDELLSVVPPHLYPCVATLRSYLQQPFGIDYLSLLTMLLSMEHARRRRRQTLTTPPNHLSTATRKTCAPSTLYGIMSVSCGAHSGVKCIASIALRFSSAPSKSGLLRAKA